MALLGNADIFKLNKKNMQRFAFKVKLKPGFAAEYERRHIRSTTPSYGRESPADGVHFAHSFMYVI